jgi:uncharacterized repeat protein (TIGR01451 family)
MLAYSAYFARFHLFLYKKWELARFLADHLTEQIIYDIQNYVKKEGIMFSESSQRSRGKRMQASESPFKRDIRRFTMKRLLTALLLCAILFPLGCRQQQTTGNERVTSNSPDPFMAVSYEKKDVGRPVEPQKPDELDPFEKLFRELGSFGNIANNPDPFRAPPSLDDYPSETTTNQTPVVETREQPVGTFAGSTTQPTTPSINRMPKPMVPVTSMSYGTGSGNLVAVSEPGPHHISMIYPSPEYGIVKLDKIIPNEVNADQPFKYAIVVTNLTNTVLPNVTITETLSDNFGFENADPMPQQQDGQLSWQIDTLGAKSAEQITVFGRSRDVNTLRNSTKLSYSFVASSSIRVVKPELEIARLVPSETLLSDSFPVEYIIRNVGSGSARDVKILETLPSGLVTTDGLSEVKFEVGVLRGGEQRTFKTELRANRIGVFANKALALSSTTPRAESAPTSTSVRQPELVITKSGPERQYLGRPLSYEITVVNQGDGVSQNTILEDSIPIDVTAIEASAGADISGSRLRWDLSTIAPNSSKTVRVSYRPTKVGVYTSDTTASSHGAEAISSKTKTTVIGIPIVRLDVAALEDPVAVGENVTYVITAANDGSAPDHNIRVVCQLEDKIQYISSSGATEASVMGHTISFTQLRTLEPNTKATWRIVCRATSPGGVRFKVNMTSDVLSRPIDVTKATYLYE